MGRSKKRSQRRSISIMKTVVGDSDVLIALYLETDKNYSRAVEISEFLYNKDIHIVFPNTTIAEAVTTFHRKFSNPKLAASLIDHYREGRFNIEYIDEKIMMKATQLYNPKGSKQNTFFDAIVAAVAKKLNADAIFSFDDWYTKLGFKLASKLLS